MWKYPDGTVKRGLPTSYIDDAGRSYNKEWFDKAILNPDMLYSIGFKNFVEESFDKRFYKSTSFEDVVDGNTVTRTHTTEAIYTVAELQEELKYMIKSIAHNILSNTEWYVIRYTEREVAIPTEVANYRAAVVSATSSFESSIDAESSYAALIVLFDAFTFPDTMDYVSGETTEAKEAAVKELFIR